MGLDMATTVIVHKGRDVILPVSFPYDVSNDIWKSQIRRGTNPESLLLAEWSIAMNTDGSDGLLLFTLPSSVTSLITGKYGYMDIKRITAGEQYNATQNPIPVSFLPIITT